MAMQLGEIIGTTAQIMTLIRTTRFLLRMSLQGWKVYSVLARNDEDLNLISHFILINTIKMFQFQCISFC